MWECKERHHSSKAVIEEEKKEGGTREHTIVIVQRVSPHFQVHVSYITLLNIESRTRTYNRFIEPLKSNVPPERELGLLVGCETVENSNG